MIQSNLGGCASFLPSGWVKQNLSYPQETWISVPPRSPTILLCHPHLHPQDKVARFCSWSYSLYPSLLTWERNVEAGLTFPEQRYHQGRQAVCALLSGLLAFPCIDI